MNDSNKMDEFKKKFIPIMSDFSKKINNLIVECFNKEKGIDEEGYVAIEIICSMVTTAIIDMNSNEQLKAMLYIAVINNLLHMQSNCIAKCVFNNDINENIKKSVH